jgi:hypothetical protein
VADAVRRSPDYPRPDSRDDRVYRSRIRENVAARVVSCEPSRLLEEPQRGRTFSRRVRYRLEPAGEGTRLAVEDEISFRGLAVLAACRPRRAGALQRSLERLRESAGRR